MHNKEPIYEYTVVREGYVNQETPAGQEIEKVESLRGVAKRWMIEGERKDKGRRSKLAKLGAYMFIWERNFVAEEAHRVIDSR